MNKRTYGPAQQSISTPVPAVRPSTSLARISTRLADPWVEAAVSGTRPARAGWSDRADGWTADRIRTFLSVLAECGVVGDAARAAGMSRQKAYAFRGSARGRAFAFAWRTALLRARDRLADEVMSRALEGCVDVIVRDGEVWGERHRFDNRLTMAVLTRLDSLAALRNVEDDAPARVEPEFEELVDRVCEGGEATAVFLRARCPPAYWRRDHAEHLERAERYGETGSGLPEEDPAEAGTLAEAQDEDEDAIDWDALLSGEWDEEEQGEEREGSSEEEGDTLPQHMAGEDLPSAAAGDKEVAANDEPHRWHLTPLSPSSTLPSGLGQAAPAPAAAQMEPGDPPPRIGERGMDPAAPIARSASYSAEPPEWILGDDGLAIRTVAGRLPPHLRRPCAQPRG